MGVICCCYWPLECCGAGAAQLFNKMRQFICPCVNEFLFLTIDVDKVVLSQVSKGAGGRPGKRRDMEVGVSFGQVWPMGSYSVTETLQHGRVVQPMQLDPLSLNGG